MLFRVLIALALTIAGASAQTNLRPGLGTAGVDVSPGIGIASAAAGCTEATNFLGRTSGLNATHRSAYTTLICGMVTDGTWSGLTGLYIFATQDQTTALLNLVSTSFSPAGTTGSPPFAADTGFTTSTGKYITPGFTSATGQRDSVLYTFYTRTSGTASNQCQFGSISGVTFAWVQLCLNDGGVIDMNVNDLAGSPGSSPADVQGQWAAVRSGGSATALYKNTSTTPVGTTSAASQSPVGETQALIVGGEVISGSTGSFAFSGNVAAFSYGTYPGSASATIAFMNRINCFLTAVGANVYTSSPAC